MDYMVQEKDHFSPYITEDFQEYIERKSQDKVHGNNLELQAIAEMYNRPIEVYTYSSGK
jgi:OTU domain-containing protein 5